MTVQAILDTLDGVPEQHKAFYGEQDGKFVLDVAKYTEAQIGEATNGLKSKNDELLAEKKAAAAKAKEAEDAAAKAAEEAAKKNGDVEALTASWQKKLEDAQSQSGEALTKAQEQIQKLTKGAAATKLAAEMAVEGSAGILERFISDRLDVDTSGDDPVIRVLDKAGKPSAMSLDDLKTEFSGDAAFAPLISGSKASGGGAAGANGGAGKQKQITRSDYDALSPSEQHKAVLSGATIID